MNKSSSESFKRNLVLKYCPGMCYPQSSRRYTAQNCCFFGLVKQKTFSPGQIYVALSSWTSFSKLNMVSKFYPKIISEIQLALEQ